MNDSSAGAPERCSVEGWLQRIRDKKLMLPSFQRGLVWKDKQAEDLLCSLLNLKPVGTLLLLDYQKKDNSIFKCHGIRNAPEPSVEDCDQLILDGQQRLTTLWRAFNIDYQDEGKDYFLRLFLKVESKDASDFAVEEVVTKKQKTKFEKVDFLRLWQENLLPVGILGPEGGEKVGEWCDKVCQDAASESRALERKISKLSEQLRHRDISYYCLPKETERDEAIEVFIKTNESSAKISRFDIAVAEIEKGTGEVLRDRIENIEIGKERQVRFFGDDTDKRIQKIGEFVLKVACLRSDKLPTDSNYTDRNVTGLIADADAWKGIVAGMDWAIEQLENEKIYDEKRLPSLVPFQALVALHELLPNDTDHRGAFRKAIKQYLWHAFLTDRYERTANSRLWEDYRGLKGYLEGPMDKNVKESDIPIFRGKEFSLPKLGELASVSDPLSSPTTKNRLARALLCISLQNGAEDLASEESITAGNIRDRQYHHLFPKALLEDEGRKKEVVNHALNYALISSVTNNKLQAKPPIQYLRERLNRNRNEADMKKLLASHRVPFDELNVKTGKEGNYEAFLKRRAEIFLEIIKTELCPQ